MTLSAAPPPAAGAGQAAVYAYDGAGAWQPLGGAALAGAAPGDRFGAAVALKADGSVLAVGAPAAGAGQARAYHMTTCAAPAHRR